MTLIKQTDSETTFLCTGGCGRKGAYKTGKCRECRKLEKVKGGANQSKEKLK